MPYRAPVRHVAALAFAVFTLAACSAPGPEEACEAFCDQVIFTCGADLGERTCMWACLAGVEWRKQKGKRCHRAARSEYACLATVSDCDFLLSNRTYRRGDPCASEGNSRANSCEERGVRPDDLVPLDGEALREALEPDDDPPSGLERIDAFDLGL